VRIGNFADQELLNDSLRNAACNGSSLDWKMLWAAASEESRAHPFWQTRAFDGRTVAEHAAVHWPPSCELDRLRDGESFVDPDVVASHAPEDAPRWALYKSSFLMGVHMPYLDLHVPPDASLLPGGERFSGTGRFVGSPEWLFGGCDAALAGWHSSALVHLVGCGANWAGGERLLTSRRALMVAAGAWRPVAHERSWRGKVLTRGYLELDPALAALPDTATKAEVARLIQRLIAAAAAQDRIAVLPPLSCDMAWIHKEPWARGGVFDPAVVYYRKRCYPAPAGACGHDLVVGGYEMHALRPTEANLTVLTAWPTETSVPDDVRRECDGYWL